MNTPTALVDPGSGMINLDQPGTYLHWSIFTVSVANLVLIAVMVVIFGVALVLPFPQARTSPAEELPAGTDPGTLAGSPGRRSAADLGEDENAGMWTSRLRRRALAMLPPGKLLPDRSPPTWRRGYTPSGYHPGRARYPSSSGFAIALGGAGSTGGTPPVGRFFKTACTCGAWSCSWRCMVIHLWGKFWMAA